jgi:hypothetical protein
MLTASHTSEMGASRSCISRAARALILSSMTRLLPPLLPPTLAASSPAAIVLSPMMSRTNSAKDANTLMTSLPPGVEQKKYGQLAIF